MLFYLPLHVFSLDTTALLEYIICVFTFIGTMILAHDAIMMTQFRVSINGCFEATIINLLILYLLIMRNYTL